VRRDCGDNRSAYPARSDKRPRVPSRKPSGSDATRHPRSDPGAEAAFPIVALGASAGGLEALEQFFRAMPADSGMGFVVVPHLDPKLRVLTANRAFYRRFGCAPAGTVGHGLFELRQRHWDLPAVHELLEAGWPRSADSSIAKWRSNSAAPAACA